MIEKIEEEKVVKVPTWNLYCDMCHTLLGTNSKDADFGYAFRFRHASQVIEYGYKADELSFIYDRYLCPDCKKKAEENYRKYMHKLVEAVFPYNPIDKNDIKESDVI